MIRRWTQSRNETNRSIVQDCYMSGPIGYLAKLAHKAVEPIAIKALLAREQISLRGVEVAAGADG